MKGDMMTPEQQENLLAELEMLRSELASKSSRIESLESEVAGLETVKSSLEHRVSDLETTKSSLEHKISGLETTKSSLENKVAGLETSKSSLEHKVSDLERQLEWLRRKVFGKMSEKHLPLDPTVLNEPTLFGDLLTDEEKARLAAEADKAQQEMTRKVSVRPSSLPVRKALDLRGLEVRETHVYPDGVLDSDGKLLPEYTELGVESTDRLDHIPEQFYISRTTRHKVALRSSIQIAQPERKPILIAPLPPPVIERGIAGASVLADMEMKKYRFHLPFYRIHQQYKDIGMHISTSTLDGWHEAAVERLKHLYDILRRKVLSSDYIQMDESVIPVIDNEAHMAVKGYMWVARDAVGGDAFFHYALGSREGKVAREILGGIGHPYTLQTDGYVGYDRFERMEGVTLCACWAHARRKFSDALKESSRLATEALVYIRMLYGVEKKADEADMTPEQRTKLRQEESYKVIQEFEKWLQDTWVKVLPKSRIGEAISYAYGLLPRLSRYVNDGRVKIDNNLIENTIRPLAVGRKNYLFCRTDASAYRTAIMYSLLSACRNAGVDQRKWLTDVLTQIPQRLQACSDMSDLMPKEWIKTRPEAACKED